MENLLWEIIEKSKEGKPYMSSQQQFDNLVKLLSNYDNETVLKLRDLWNSKLAAIRDSAEFEKLHSNNGGIVSTGDDGFYMDFGNWLIAQGQGLYVKFLLDGHQAVLSYVKEHGVSDDEYTFECMVYAFQDVLKKLNEQAKKPIDPLEVKRRLLAGDKKPVDYLPEIFHDFHKTKEVFKAIEDGIVVNRRKSTDVGHREGNINWCDAMVYTIDVFLWFMADHGYQLVKTDIVPPYELKNTLAEWRKMNAERFNTTKNESDGETE